MARLSFIYFIFLVDQGLNSVLQACKAGTLLLEPPVHFKAKKQKTKQNKKLSLSYIPSPQNLNFNKMYIF
jgi:hypothetical protein